MTDPCWYCGRSSELLCDFVIGKEAWPDRCEWDPAKGALSLEGEGCTVRATQIVGADGHVRVCDSCAAAPQLKRRRSRKPLDPKARRPVTGWRGNNKLFLDELREGRRWQEWAAAELELRGLRVELPEHSERASIEYADRWTRGDKDLIVRNSAVGDCVLEVKSRPLYFIDAAGYPYPTALVDTVDGWHAKEVEPRAVLLVSRPAKRILVVSSATRREWVVKQAMDRVRNTRADFYECPRSRLASLEWLVSKLLP